MIQPVPYEGPLAEQTNDVVRELNRRHGLDVSLLTRFESGLQSGAWLLADPQGWRAVLKWSPNGSAQRIRDLALIIEGLRTAGYPTPAWIAAGATDAGLVYHVQEFASGRPSWPLTMPKAELLLEVLELHAGLDPDPARDRSAQVAAAARDESEGGYRHAVRELGPVGGELIVAYDGLLDSYGDVDLPSGDLVHGDFNTCNILLDDGQVSGVIDIEELGSGTRVIDYACLLREAYVADYPDEVKIKIHRVAEAIAGPGVLAVCAAATAFFIVGFKRRHDPQSLDQTFAALHRLAVDLSTAR